MYTAGIEKLRAEIDKAIIITGELQEKIKQENIHLGS